jgi:YVTN family beta-propeller protein
MNVYLILSSALCATSLFADIVHVPIGTRSSSKLTEVQLELIHRFQSYDQKPRTRDDIFDNDIYSPKSVRCCRDRVFVNSLEGMKTVVYDGDNFEKLGTIHHDFDAHNQQLFGEHAPVQYFSGKPVESALSHNGKYLWVPYYRRDYDSGGTLPSAVAIINTHTLAIERVMPTGPIAKYVFPSPDGKYMVVSNWGNNTLSVFNISASNTKDFKLERELVVEHVLALKDMTGDRDKNCGFCLRGLAFSNDSRYLFVARMGGGGVAVFDFKAAKGITYMGSVFGFQPTPRDVLLSPDGNALYISSNLAGYVSRVPTQNLIDAAQNSLGHHIDVQVPEELYVGAGARTIRLSQDGKYLFAALHTKSEVAVVDTRSFSVVARVPVDSYPVGLDLSPDNQRLWVTSQGVDAKGGNAVNIYAITYPLAP